MSDDKRLEPVRTKIVVDLAFNRKGERVTTLDNCFFLPSDIKGYYNFYNQKGETLATGVSNNNEFPFLHDGHAWTIYELVIDDSLATGEWKNNAKSRPVGPDEQKPGGFPDEQDGSFQAQASGGPGVDTDEAASSASA